MHYPIDHGCFNRWDEPAFLGMLGKIATLEKPPIFVCVPDVVADSQATTRMWKKYHKRINFNKAFVAQDGHEPWDVPAEAYAVFVGGSTEWKLSNAHWFKGTTKWLHIGRVNTEKRLRWAEDIGADSVDGTGVFRGRGKQYYDFINFFEREVE